MFAIDIQTYPQRGGTLRVIACIEDLRLLARISNLPNGFSGL
ncbi:MAG: hypothetical protein P8X98_09005 [Woeseiaceae bacterium]